MDEVEKELMTLKDEGLRDIALNIYRRKGLEVVTDFLSSWKKVIE